MEGFIMIVSSSWNQAERLHVIACLSDIQIQSFHSPKAEELAKYIRSVACESSRFLEANRGKIFEHLGGRI